MTLISEDFGALTGGARATLYTLWNEGGLSVSLCDYGACLVRLLAPDREGRLDDVVLGYDSAEPYVDANDFFGVICGRYANRLKGGAFTLDGRRYQVPVNDGLNALHGGANGFHRKLWRAEPTDGGVAFFYTSADGEEGFPGRLDVRVHYRLVGDDALAIDYDADTDADTILNLTNHSYFNLAGHGSGSVHAQTLQLFAHFYTPVDEALLPTGAIVPVAGTPFDFLREKPIGRDIDGDSAQLRYGGGYDHNFVLDKPERGALCAAARACDPVSGRTMEVFTTLPGVQLYTANMLAERTGKDGAVYGRRGAFCLETQFFPDSMTHSHFPSPLIRAGGHYHARTEFRFIRG